jgi:small subunit ribosomal protein S16
MLAIRMQRTGRKGHAMFRVVVQESRLTPTSGKVVSLLGSYDPHAKTTTLNKEKASFYLEHGAQPSDRAVRLFQKEGVKLPNWVKVEEGKSRKTRNAEKLRKNQPAVKEEPKAEEVEEPKTEVSEPAAEKDTEEKPEIKAEDAPKSEPEETKTEEVSEDSPAKDE